MSIALAFLVSKNVHSVKVQDNVQRGRKGVGYTALISYVPCGCRHGGRRCGLLGAPRLVRSTNRSCTVCRTMWCWTGRQTSPHCLCPRAVTGGRVLRPLQCRLLPSPVPAGGQPASGCPRGGLVLVACSCGVVYCVVCGLPWSRVGRPAGVVDHIFASCGLHRSSRGLVVCPVFGCWAGAPACWRLAGFSCPWAACSLEGWVSVVTGAVFYWHG